MNVQVLELEKCGVQLEQCQLVRYNGKSGTMGKPFDEPKVRGKVVCVSLCVCVCIYVCVSVYVCVCVHVYLCTVHVVCVCVCVWGGGECMCVCVTCRIMLPTKECLQFAFIN